MSQARARVPRFAEAAVERARLTVVPTGRTQAPRTPFAVLVLALLIVGVVGLLAFNTQMQTASFRATDMQNRADDLSAQEQKLDMELDALRDPQRLARTAKKMGMVAPTSPAFLRLSDGKVIGDPQPAGGDGAMRINPLPDPRPQSLNPTPLVVTVPAPQQPVQPQVHNNDPVPSAATPPSPSTSASTSPATGSASAVPGGATGRKKGTHSPTSGAAR